ncbi:MAG: division/cell wall cluster transcriptional repressor MraZ [Pikeienuella sp.]
MKFFSSSATNKVDAKGRVSIPAPFRKVLAMEDSPLLFLMPDVRDRPIIEGFGEAHFTKLADALDQLNPYSEEYDALAGLTVARTVQLPLDSTGRIVIPEELRALTGITDEALFVGRVRTFQIWHPETYHEIQASQRAAAAEHVTKLPWGKRNDDV